MTVTYNFLFSNLVIMLLQTKCQKYMILQPICVLIDDLSDRMITISLYVYLSALHVRITVHVHEECRAIGWRRIASGQVVKN